MIEHYSEIRRLHVATVLLSGTLFTLRGVAMLAGSAWHQQPVLKRFTYLNDSVLLLAGGEPDAPVAAVSDSAALAGG